MSQPDRPIAFGVDSLAGAKQPQGEAEGEKGSKTRTWFSLPDQPVFAVAGIWRDTDECGPAYSMVMTEACVHVADVHDRMPVILRPEDWGRWTDAPAEEARALCVPYTGEMTVNRTARCDD